MVPVRRSLVLLLVPSIASADDAELLRFVADAEAQAEASPETIIVDGEAGVDTPSAGVRVVGARALELTPHKNADDLLRVVPGLYMSQHGSEGKGQQFFLRGFDAVHGADLSLRVNGIPINELSNVHGQGYADLGFLIPETVNGLVSRKGPFDLEQGWFATAGAVDLELGTATRGRRVGYELGTTNRHRVIAIDAPKGGPEAEFVAVNAMHDDGFGEDRGTENVSAIAQTELTAGRLRLRPMITGYWSEFGEPGVVALDDIATGYFDRTSAPAGALGGRSERLLTGVTGAWKRTSNEVVGSAYLGWRSLDIQENFTGFLENPELGDGRHQTHRAVTGGGRVAWRHRLSSGLRLLTGAEVIRDQLRQSEVRIATTGEAWRTERELDATTTSTGAWAGLEARRGRWVATGGARVDAMMVDAIDRLDRMRSGAGMVGEVSPRLAVAWRGEHLSLSIAAGRGVRPPEARAFTRRASRENMDAVVYDGGDADITKANAAEVGGELRLARIAVGATGFATWIDRESIFDHLSGVNALLDGSRRIGTELFVEATPVPWLALRGDLTLVDARFVVTENPVPGAPRLLATAEARFDRKPWSAGLAGRFLGPRPLIHGATASSSTVFDAVGSYVRGRWTLSAQVDNLLGTNWNEGEFHFASRWDMAAPESELPRVHISPGRPFGVRVGAMVQF
jgi:iron complex outermembrane receptor protein